MKKIILSLAVVLALTGAAKATFLGQYDFSSGYSSIDSDANSTANAITLGAGMDTTKGSGISSGAFYFSGSGDANYNTIANAVAANDYISFTVTAAAGHFLSFSSITFDISGSNTKTGAWAIRSSQDNFAANVGTATITFANNNFVNVGSISLLGLNQKVSSIEFRLYAINNQGAYNVGIDNIALDGTTPVPEPVNVALVLFGCTFAGVGVGRKFLKKKA